MKTPSDKEILLEALKENHIVYAACRKAGIGKTTYYRWRQEDPAFAAAADTAIEEGVSLVNDAAESNIVSAIKERDQDASKFWLKARHPAYSSKIRIESEKADTGLSPEQEALVRKALELADLGSVEIISANSESHDEQKDATDAAGISGTDRQGPEGAPGAGAQ